MADVVEEEVMEEEVEEEVVVVVVVVVRVDQARGQILKTHYTCAG